MSGATAEVGMVKEECQYDGKLCVGRVMGGVVSTVCITVLCWYRVITLTDICQMPIIMHSFVILT
jgi:hypothetical protein